MGQRSIRFWRAAGVTDDLITPRQQATGLRREQELSACQEQRPGVWPLSASTMSSRLETDSVSERRHTHTHSGGVIKGVLYPSFNFKHRYRAGTRRCRGLPPPPSAAQSRMKCSRKMRNVVFVVQLNIENVVSENISVYSMLMCLTSLLNQTPKVPEDICVKSFQVLMFKIYRQWKIHFLSCKNIVSLCFSSRRHILGLYETRFNKIYLKPLLFIF